MLRSAHDLLEALEPALSYKSIGPIFLIMSILFLLTHSKGSYSAIPAVGNTGVLSSYLSALRFFKHGSEMLQEGYDKYKPGAFRVPELNRWHVVVTGEKLIEELRKAPDDVLSFAEATKDIIAANYTLGENTQSNPYHISIIRGQLTRNLGVLFSDIRDEVLHACEDNIPVTEEWTRVRAYDAMMNIVCRVSNRTFVGTPKCRNPEYIALNVQFTTDVVIAGKIINLFPDFMKPLAGRLFTKVPGAIQTCLKHLRPIIEERQRKIDEYGFNYPDKPNDMLSWLMDEARGEERSTRNLALRVLILNFASIHTSSITFTQALLDLACLPQCIPPIREEVQVVIAGQGWSKAALTNMRKLDSFFKESQRLHGLGAVSMSRKVLKEFTFSDGTHVPKGGVVSAIATARQRDNEVYPNGADFRPFRFSNIGDEDGQGPTNQMVATSLDYLPFGHGRHACPGRFFAGIEMKAMMAHMVLTYDIKMADEGVLPQNIWYGTSCIPDSKVEVLFRKRQL